VTGCYGFFNDGAEHLRVSTSRGVIREGSTTLTISVEEEVDAVLEAIDTSLQLQKETGGV
jgi:uncharacterized protein YaaQ